ncbi:MAG: hypothetical protein J0L64_27090 [Acidobacteria bacterium]|nr:hypothetical protein [Acidobacteriota bacterium]
MDWFWQFLAILASVLQVLLVGSMQNRGLYRLYPFLFLHSLVLLLASVVEWTTLRHPSFANFYWTNEVVLQVLLLLTMLHFIYVALETDPARRRKVALIGLAILIVSVTLATFNPAPPRVVPQDRQTTYFMTLLSRNLSFCTALLNVVLWSSLLHFRRRDVQMLMLAAGTGVFTTGKAIGHSLRMLDKDLAMAGNGVVVVTALLALMIWTWSCWSLRPRLVERMPLPAAAAGEPLGRS